MKHIIKIGQRYYYSRRVPVELSEYDPREYVRTSLKTDSLNIANHRAAVIDQQTQAYWQELIKLDRKHSHASFQNVVKRAKLLGFDYKTVNELTQSNIEELVRRTEFLEDRLDSEKVVEAVFGGAEVAGLSLSDVEGIFWRITQNRIMNKSEDQIRKWQTPRKRAFKNLITLIGNKSLMEFNRNDMITFRDWWISRIKKEGLSKNSANKEIHAIKNMIEAVNDHERLSLDTSWLFSKIGLQERRNMARRPSFSAQYIISNILSRGCLSNLNEEAKAIVQVLAETGARPKEICCLSEEDIILEHYVPHIKIRFKEHHELKTVYSERDIPLIGNVLQIFQKFPAGFPRYFDRSESLSATVNKYLKQNSLLPSDKHSLYSLRHSFQDRMTEVNMPDRVQCELFGHKFNRPEYGSGPSLELKREWLEKISLGK